MSDVVYDTIVAVATPPGRGGISIVRISGNMSLGIADSIFRCARGKRPSEYVSNTVSYGHVVSRSGEVIDEAMLTVMRAPKSYTAEDTVEISCHGGMLPSGRIVELCVEEGARIADPGEFTKRAFLNGRMDLSQAEAVLDIINAETDVSRRIALEQLEGRLSGSIGDIIDGLTEVLSLIELGIDFSDEDVELPGERDIVGKITGMRKRIKALLDTADKGMMLRNGASVVICGRPNVGKSSLMNALLRHDRVIVTPVAGTTRDVVEECLEISGVKVRISDTAGIIDTRDRVELEGIKRSKEKLATADAVIFVLDMSSEMSTQDIGIFDTVKDKKVIVTANKDDLLARLDVRKAEKTLGVESILRMSVREDRGIDLVEKALADTLLGEGVSLEGTVLTGIRHKDAFEKALRCVERAVESYEDGYTAELMASDINEAIYHMNTVTGENVSPDILERIFSKFCIGK